MKTVFKISVIFVVLSLLMLACVPVATPAAATETPKPPPEKLKVAMLIPGAIDDGGYYQAGYDGLMRIKDELGAEVSYINNIPTELEPLSAALEKLAESKPDMIMSHGGITADAVAAVSKNHPDIQFVLSQGGIKDTNLSVYQVSYEQATWLAGAAAGLLTKTNVVSHISGKRVAGGVKSRNAFADGLKYTNPEATFLTTFTGDLNDADLAKRTAQAQIDAGSDIIFAMLNDAMPGVTEAVKENGIRQVGDVHDFCATDPDVFQICALEDIGLGLVEAAKAYQAGTFESNVVKNFGLETPGAVGVSFASDVPEEVKVKIDELKQKITNKEIVVSTEYDGPEFEIPVAAKLKVAMIIPGKIDDGGFMQGGYEGLMKIRDELGAEVEYIADIEPKLEVLKEAIDKLAQGNPDLLMAHGGQNAAAMQEMSVKYPKIQFVVLHGNVKGPNLSSYGVLEEQATWLAGAAAGLLTKTNVVGHMSGLRVPAGVKARGAFADGLKYTNPGATFITNFSGDLNDQALAEKIAKAEIDKGADLIFAMLNDGMPGVTKAVVEAGIHQIGNSKNRTATEPEIFIISALTNVSLSSFTAASDFVKGTYQPDVIHPIGIETEGAIGIAMADYVPEDVKAKVKELEQLLADGKIQVNTDYSGPEFELK
ncbi:MAG: BMP family protein [Anaerolineaceae bacterium]|nr:BMP family protein [Anaerolineaceae bacterium]